MHASRSRTFAAFLAVLALAAGCSRERQDWRAAEAADDLEAYDRFLARHPEGELAGKARARVAQLAEERDWQRASQADSARGYEEFLAQHPEGKWSQEARIRMENFALEEGDSVASTPIPVPAAPPPERAPPPPAERAVPRTRAVPSAPDASPGRATPGRPSSARHAIQLGAFSDEKRARAEWQRLTVRFPRELARRAARFVPADTTGGRVVRLQALVEGGEGEARALCAALKGAGQGCVVVLPAGAST